MHKEVWYLPKDNECGQFINANLYSIVFKIQFSVVITVLGHMQNFYFV